LQASRDAGALGVDHTPRRLVEKRVAARRAVAMPPRTKSSIQTFTAAKPSAVRASRFSRRFACAASSNGFGGASAAAFSSRRA
jgi:hypothetical protein